MTNVRLVVNEALEHTLIKEIREARVMLLLGAGEGWAAGVVQLPAEVEG